MDMLFLFQLFKLHPVLVQKHGAVVLLDRFHSVRVLHEGNVLNVIQINGSTHAGRSRGGGECGVWGALGLTMDSIQTELQSVQIESIVNSVLKRVNAQVEKAIAEAMADLRKETRNQNEPKDKRGTDPFENSVGTAQSY